MKEIDTTSYISISPCLKWQGLIPIMVAVLANPKASDQSKREIQAELISLAKWADEHNEKVKEQKNDQ